MVINDIEEFIVLAETTNFRAASERLGISQSSLSKHIQRLEEELASSLFVRNTRKVALTEFGIAFLPYAEKFQSLKRECIDAGKERRNATEGTLNIGLTRISPFFGAADLVDAFKKENPLCSVATVEAKENMIKELLGSGDCDLIFAHLESRKDIRNDSIINVPCESDHLAVLLPKEHILSQSDRINIRDLKNDHFLFPPKDSHLFYVCLSACRQAGFEPNISLIGLGGASLVSVVAEGAGAALLLKKETRGLMSSRIRIVDVAPRVIMDIMYDGSKALSFAAVRFLEFARQYKINFKQ